MIWTDRIRQVKIVLVTSAVLIAAASLVISHFLVRDLSREERNKMEVWAEAMRSLNSADETTDLALVLRVLGGNNTIPVVVLDSRGEVQDYRNMHLRAATAADTTAQLQAAARAMKHAGDSIRVSLGDVDSREQGDDYMEICFSESLLLRRLAYYPYVQLGVVLIFVVVAIFALLSSKKAEQNKVWVGLSKETAHQLGTPISSLMAWVEVLRENYPDDELIPEMDNDVKRLQRIAERFSKIGSLPEPKPESLSEVIDNVVRYIGRRTSNKVSLTTQLPAEPLMVPLSAPLFEWVVENLCKNAIDAMEGQGSITITAVDEGDTVAVEVADTGKGIPAKHVKTVFTPGFTTKQRGWGLGLSLAKRIVEEYHRGRIYVKNSEVGHGTTFRIELRK
ncbi:MAG: HAMP domain-containing histidine kinase [Bacteroidaceae bacterium]|nr:HAMP domain-containing histidine kinase [Bacteroidaceae bacterium]